MPAFLTFGPLVLTDVAIALFTLLALWELGELWRNPDRRNVFRFGLALAGALAFEVLGRNPSDRGCELRAEHAALAPGRTTRKREREARVAQTSVACDPPRRGDRRCCRIRSLLRFLVESACRYSGLRRASVVVEPRGQATHAGLAFPARTRLHATHTPSARPFCWGISIRMASGTTFPFCWF